MCRFVALYRVLSADARLAKNWERNQPRIDRALEAGLIATTPCEVATAALLAVKLKYEPSAGALPPVTADAALLDWASGQGSGGGRLARVARGEVTVDALAVTAAVHALRFYRDRCGPNELVRLPWSRRGLEALSRADPAQVLHPTLRPPWAERKARGLCCLARLLLDAPGAGDEELYGRLRAVPGLGPERADAAGVFAFRRPWPITDNYLWRLLGRHRLLTREEERLARYADRRTAFRPHWEALLAAGLGDPNELAATLYLWACEVGRRGFSYALR